MAEFENNPQSAKIDAVRDLIFGQNLKEYDRELHDINRKMAQNRDQVNSEINAVRDQILQSLAALEENIMNRIQAVREATQQELKRQEESHVSKESLGKVLSEVARNL